MNHTSAIAKPTEASRGLKISAKGVAKGLLVVVGLLFFLHSTGVVLESILEYESRVTRIMVRYFDFNGEENVPAFFSSVILLLAAGLLLLIYRASQSTGSNKSNGYWLALTVVFVFMAVDESVQIHEHIAESL